MRVPVVVAFALALLAALPTAAADVLSSDAVEETIDPVAAEFLIGYGKGQRDLALLDIERAGGIVQRHDKDLRMVVATTVDSELFEATLADAASIEWTDTNGATRLHGAQWNGAQWNGAQWNGAQWNGAEWNSAQMDGAQWNEAHGAPDAADDPGRGAQWGLVAANVPPAWSTTMGQGRSDLCILDSGVDLDHPDLEANLWTGPDGSHGENMVAPGSPPDDDAGHGTHMAGIAAGVAGNAWGIAGVGNVRIMSVKVLDASGAGTEADLAWGISWCASQGADVALMALGLTEASPAVDRALSHAAARGVVLVASSGNGGCDDCVGSPATHPDVIGVGAIDPALAVAAFSSRGSEVDIAAPGVDVLSTFAGGAFAYGSGTSQSAAHVAGAAALLRDANGGLGAAATRDALLSTARDAGPPGHDEAYGEGLLDVGAAMARAS